MTIYDLYVTAHCPRGVRCESCGTEHGLLQPWAVRVAKGVLCLTLCPTCAGGITRDGVAPPITDATAGRLVEQHCEHLKLSRHDMGLVLTETDQLAREALAAAAANGALAVDSDYVRGVELLARRTERS